ncbi:MAG: hypothetical protein JWL62_3838 [Hyphomicrobiales bacterium]|nr:hypothetical protein [Hyphomicrobiales bacterium]
MDRDPPSMRIRCALCNKRVDNWEGWFDRARTAIVITVECHGARDEMVFPAYASYDPESYQEMLQIWQGNVEGVAFTPALAQGTAPHTGRQISQLPDDGSPPLDQSRTPSA